VSIETQLSVAKIEIFSADWCGYCRRAKKLLDAQGATYEVIDAPTNRQIFLERTNSARTIPQIFINDELVGGYTELKALVDSGEFGRIVEG
jgi:glutaredoxin 3